MSVALASPSPAKIGRLWPQKSLFGGWFQVLGLFSFAKIVEFTSFSCSSKKWLISQIRGPTCPNFHNRWAERTQNMLEDEEPPTGSLNFLTWLVFFRNFSRFTSRLTTFFKLWQEGFCGCPTALPFRSQNEELRPEKLHPGP